MKQTSTVLTSTIFHYFGDIGKGKTSSHQKKKTFSHRTQLVFYISIDLDHIYYIFFPTKVQQYPTESG